jgi:molybdenum cofactor biosynthesis enzyme MoaA
MSLTIRFLLTSKCTASCGYCHNEGQTMAGNLLSLETIRNILRELTAHNCLPKEFVLSGGEPTLHKHVAEIARLCKSTGASVSMDSHAGHPDLLAPVLPYLDELKIHVDSFDAEEQKASMGIELENVLTSIRIAQQYPLLLRTNHPLSSAEKTSAFIRKARHYGIDCKIIEMFGLNAQHVHLKDMNWERDGYHHQADGSWLHENGKRRLFTKRCGKKYNTDQTLFIGADGIRRDLKGIIIGQAKNFSIQMLRPTSQA